jgi:hypothetical protein
MVKRLRFAVALTVVLAAGLVAQEPPVTVSGANVARLTQAERNDLRVAADMPDTVRVCIDEAMTVCLTVGEIRALAYRTGELGAFDVATRTAIDLQGLAAATVAELDQCRGQLGPLRAQANQRAVQDQFEAWIADLEKRHPGWVYDRQTGTLKPRIDSPKGGGQP